MTHHPFIEFSSTSTPIKSTSRIGKLALATCLALALSACGGGGNPESTPTAGSDSGGGGSTGGGNNGGGGTTNNAPIANNDTGTVTQGSSNVDLDVLANDTDADGDAIQLTNFPATTSGSGSLSRNDAGTPNDLTDDTLSYTPNSSFTGTDTFNYDIADGNGGVATGTVTLQIEQDDSPPPQNSGCRDRQNRLDAGLGYCFDAEFNTSHDGTNIDMTVYLPHPDKLRELAADSQGSALPADDPGFAPLIIHGHGFGGSKNEDFDNEPGHFVDNQTARELWLNKGYFVISFSERGFGQSGGEIGFMQPSLEGQDINELLDWAIQHLRGDSSAGANDGIYATGFVAADHSSSVIDTNDSRPSLLQNDVQSRLQISASTVTGDDNPAVGTIGYSYGGGFQYTASAADTNDVSNRTERERFDALIPEGTWHDLRYSLNANDAPKSYWATLLFSFAVNGGTATNGSAPPPFLIDVYREATTTGRVSADNQNFLGGNGTSFYCDENNGVTTNAALFHIQGIRDTLFNFNDGFNNAQCFANAGNDVRFLSVSGGHPYTPTQQAPYTGNRTSMDIDEVIHCQADQDLDGDGDMGAQERLIVKDMMQDWFEEKLRGKTGQADYIPAVCITAHNTDSSDSLSDPNFHPAGDTTHTYLKEGVSYSSLDDVLIGAGAAPTYSCDNDTDHVCEIPATNLQLGGTNELAVSAFVPLVTISETRLMAGIPTVKLSFDRTFAPVDPKIYLGTAIQRDGSTIILHDQLTPVRDTAAYPYTDTRGVVTENGNAISYGCGIDKETLCDRGRLAGVAARLLPGDIIGLQIKTADMQYQALTNALGQITISGDVELPILAPSALPETNHPATP